MGILVAMGGFARIANDYDRSPQAFERAAQEASQSAGLAGGGSNGDLFAALPPGQGAPSSKMGQTDRDKMQSAFRRGVEAQRANRPDDAIAAYREILHLDPKITPARLNLAMVYRQMNRNQDALTQLQIGASHEPKNPVIQLQIAQLLLDLKQPNAALAALRRTTQLAPSDSPLHWQARSFAGQLLLSLKRPREAYVEWAALARLRPGDMQANYTAGVLAVEEMHRIPEGEKFLRRAWSAMPADVRLGDPRVPLLFARVLGAQKKLDEAQRVLQKAASRFPDNIDIHGMLSDVRWTRGDKAGAIATLRQIIARVPATRDSGRPLGNLRTVLAKQLASNGDVAGAVRELRAATLLLPREPEPQALLAEALARSGQREEAATAIRRLLELDPKRDQARVLLARVLADLGRPTEAQDQYELFLKAHPKEIAVWAERAALYEKRENLPAALDVWNKVEALAPKNPVAALQRARLFRQQGKSADAMGAYSTALRIDPKNSTALFGAAEMAETIGHHDRAVQHAQTLIALDPNNDAAYDMLLRAASKGKKLDDALTFLRTQLGRNAERPSAYAAVLAHFTEAGSPGEGEKFVADIARRYPKAKAPKAALAVVADRKASAGVSPIAAPTPAPSPSALPTR